ncbi:MAG: hypothetical protein GF308_10750 [Candidatus Heimdallarchaeota archaeon]|nr:hypothetical protein [Candidatus Heimdallarchaeota archaeon]
MNNRNNKKKHIHVILGPQRFRKFQRIKEQQEINSDVDVMRYCIDEIYQQLQQEKIDLRPILKQQIELMLSNDYLKAKHLVLNINDVINEAVYQWIQNKKNEINLHHFPFRQELKPEEQKIAMVFIEHQLDYEKGMTMEDIKSYLPELPETRLQRIIKKFVDNELLLSNKLNGLIYYYAPVP